MKNRTDIHSPSNIEPKDYSYFAAVYCGSDPFIQIAYTSERKRIQDYLNDDDPSHKISSHNHGGICHICGAVNIAWAHYYTHEPTGNLIIVGEDCAQKLDLCSAVQFRSWKKQHKDALERARGKGKAKAILEEAGLEDAWALYEADYDSLPQDYYQQKQADGSYLKASSGLKYEERTARDIVGRLVKWGSVSEKAIAYLKVLVEEKIPNRAKIEGKIKAAATRERKKRSHVGEVGKRIKSIKVTVDKVVNGTNSYDEPWRLTLLRTESGDILKYWGFSINQDEGDVLDDFSFTVKAHQEGTSKYDKGVAQTLIQRPYIK